jgi:putative zinc finger protein
MNCSEVQKCLSAYYDGELANNQRSRLSIHLNECSDCVRQLTGFERLSSMANALSTPVPPDHLWSRIEQQLNRQRNIEQPIAKSVDRTSNWILPATRLYALAATVLIAVGISWATYHAWFSRGEQHQFTAEFGHYLEEFRHDPATAQQILLAKYENQLIDPRQAIELVGYRPAVADGLPKEYVLESTHVMKMPCCTCVQSICKRIDGTTLAIFEHNDNEGTEWFGDRPEIMARCNDKRCYLIEMDDQIAASWKRGTRHITLIGVRDVAEVSQMIAQMDERKQRVLN